MMPQRVATPGRLALRAEVARFGRFLLVGGTASALDLSVLALLTIVVGWGYFPSALFAIESGIALSFALNDRLTFAAFAGRAGHWTRRCLRFHGAAALGQVLTLAIAGSAVLVATPRVPSSIVRYVPVLSQATAIGIVLFFNFGVHRLWTYRRHVPRARPDEGAPNP